MIVSCGSGVRTANQPWRAPVYACFTVLQLARKPSRILYWEASLLLPSLTRVWSKLQDLGNNFFLESSHLGHSKAQHVTELLKELNESVTGSYVQESPQELIQNQPSFFSNFDLVIATQV